MPRHVARCDCSPTTLHRVIDRRAPGYWVTTMLRGECSRRGRGDGLVIYDHLDFQHPEDEELGNRIASTTKSN